MQLLKWMHFYSVALWPIFWPFKTLVYILKHRNTIVSDDIHTILSLHFCFLHSYSRTSTSNNRSRTHIITVHGASQFLEALLFGLIRFLKPPLRLSLCNPSLLGQGVGCPFLSAQWGNANGIAAEPRQLADRESRRLWADLKHTVCRWATGDTHWKAKRQ